MVLAVEAGHRMDRQGVEKWMVWTIFGGLTFLTAKHGNGPISFMELTQVRLLDGSIMYGANLQLNQYGPPDFAAFFFFITGFHGFHVFSGKRIKFFNFLSGDCWYSRTSEHNYEWLKKLGSYWHC